MPAIIGENSSPREIWVTFVDPDNGQRRTEKGEPPNGAIDNALFGQHGMGFIKQKISILPYGVAIWGYGGRGDSRTVIPYHDVIKIEEVF